MSRFEEHKLIRTLQDLPQQFSYSFYIQALKIGRFKIPSEREGLNATSGDQFFTPGLVKSVFRSALGHCRHVEGPQ